MWNTHWCMSNFLLVLLSGVLLIYGVSSAAPNEGPLVNEPAPAAVELDPEPSIEPPHLQEEPGPQAEPADIQERGVLPGRTVAPDANFLPIPAPTPSLTAIRNAIQITSKSISVNLRLPANLPVTVPIEVNVAYNSSAQTQRQTKTYTPATGLVIGYREAEGDGKPRAMRLDITVRELVPNGQSFSVSKQFTITPLYDVFLSDLRFYMASGCDRSLPTFNAKSEINFLWYPPDSQIYHVVHFKLGRAEAQGITQFFWARKEVSTQANLKEPSVYFDENDFGTYSPYRIRIPDRPLVPGPTTKYHFFLRKEETGPPGRPSYSGARCEAEITYTIIRALVPFDQF